MRVLNEKYIVTQQRENNHNGTHSAMHVYALSVVTASHRTVDVWRKGKKQQHEERQRRDKSSLILLLLGRRR